MKRKGIAGLALLLMVAMAGAQAPKNFQPTQLRGFPVGTLDIERTGGRDTLHVWLADTEARQDRD